MKVGLRIVSVADAESRARGDAILGWLRGWAGLFGVQVEEKYGGAWTRASFEASCAAAERGAREEAWLPAPGEVNEAIASVITPIGDVEQQLPGERLELDALLRRDQ